MVNLPTAPKPLQYACLSLTTVCEEMPALHEGQLSCNTRTVRMRNTATSKKDYLRMGTTSPILGLTSISPCNHRGSNHRGSSHETDYSWNSHTIIRRLKYPRRHIISVHEGSFVTSYILLPVFLTIVFLTIVLIAE